MQATINGKIYNTDKCHTLASYDHHNNGNYSGTTSLIEASNGTLLVYTDSNGQDCWLRDCLFAWKSQDHDLTIDDFKNIRDQQRLVELKLIEVVE